jgi:hypothetical protein
MTEKEKPKTTEEQISDIYDIVKKHDNHISTIIWQLNWHSMLLKIIIAGVIAGFFTAVAAAIW